MFFSGLKGRGFIVIVKPLEPLARYGGINKDTLADFSVQGHFDACDRFSNSALSNPNTFSTQRAIQGVSAILKLVHTSRLTPFRISRYRNSLVSYLVRLRVTRELAM